MNYYDILRRSYKAFKRKAIDQTDLSLIAFENDKTIINLKK